LAFSEYYLLVATFFIFISIKASIKAKKKRVSLYIMMIKYDFDPGFRNKKKKQ